MKNRFFKIALLQATKLAGKPARIMAILVELSDKATRVDWSANGLIGIRNKMRLATRLIQASVKGTYRLNSAFTLISLLAAIIYFINPLDLVPDMVIGLGLADDITVLSWVFKSLSQELATFEAWEKSNATFSSL